MSMSCDKTFLLVPSSRSSIEVEYQGHNFQKMAVAEALVFRKHIMFLIKLAAACGALFTVFCWYHRGQCTYMCVLEHSIASTKQSLNYWLLPYIKII